MRPPTLALLCLALVGVGLTGCDTGDAAPPGELYARAVEGNVFQTAPPRGELKPLLYKHAGFTYRCSECHTDFGSPPVQGDPEGEHDEIVLNHGLNTNCLNCHHRDQRDMYVDHEGKPIDPAHPVELCRKCHGPIYREWEHGVHGRQNGYWKPEMGEKNKLKCIQCHDPHSPQFPKMKPDPAPDYSRLREDPPRKLHHDE